MIAMSEKKGVAGWLLLPAFITLVMPLIFGTVAYNYFFILKKIWPDLGKLQIVNLIFIGLESIWTIGFFCCSLASLYLLVRRSPVYPNVSTAFWFVFLGCALIDITANSVILHEPVGSARFIALSIMLGMSIFWLTYMRRSRRVRNTFV
jgi:hypothetical protein